MFTELNYFRGRVETTYKFYPIVRLDYRSVVATKWKMLGDGNIEVLEYTPYDSKLSRMSEEEKLAGCVTNSMEFIYEG